MCSILQAVKLWGRLLLRVYRAAFTVGYNAMKFLLVLILALASSHAWAGTYHLDINRIAVNITGTPTKKIMVNGTIPGPILHFTEGENVTIIVTNHMNEPTAIHWHGFLLPGEMDGVPGFNGFPGIAPGSTYTYHFIVHQSGTYWYHAHEDGQEQDGLYGAIVIAPKVNPIKADRDYVVLISDFTVESADTILQHLKMNSSYYNYHQRTISDFFHDIKTMGLGATWQDRKVWGQMRMSPTDLSDVSGYSFLINGKTLAQNWTGLFKSGEHVRLRFINASAMSIYDVRIPGLKMTVVAVDGQEVEPLPVDEFRFGNAETYDVIVEPKENKAYTIAAEPIDRSGFAIGTLAPNEGMRGEIPAHRPRSLLTMADMNMQSMMKDSPNMDMSSMAKSGWADAHTPPGHKVLDYKDLRYLGIQKDTRQPDREILVTLGGNMQRFTWTINGKKSEETEPIQLKYGERVRLKFVNETMMAHPMHLHGMFVQLENGQPAGKLPNKHTVIIPPGQTYSVLLTADTPGEWAFHCHLLYHMQSGMMNKVVVAKLDTPPLPMEAMHHTDMHPAIFHAFRLEAGTGSGRDHAISSWDLRGWIGGNDNKLWLRSEGEHVGNATEKAEFWALYSRNIASFWDAQIGFRHDTNPDATSYLTMGFNGLAPYFFETEAHLFLGNEGKISARIREEKDFRITQQLITQPYMELNFFDSMEKQTFGVQTRYEVTRQCAPYMDIRYERQFGGGNHDDVIAATGLRLMF